MTKISVLRVKANGGTQSRAQISQEAVAEYAEAMSEGAIFPPVVVFYDGSDYWLADGFHRYQAANQAHIYEIDADIRQGSQRDAILHSVGANASHGLRRTNDDKRRAVMVLLNDAQWSKWSNREIARQCGVSESLVRDVRPICDKNADSEPRRVTRNGTTYEQNTANIGGQSKPDQKKGTASEPQENIGETPDGLSLDTTTLESDQESDQIARLRKTFRELTPEAQEDDWIGVRLDLEDEKAKRKAAEAEAKTLKARIKDLEADEKNEVIRRLQAEAKNAGNAKWKALEDRDAYHRQVYALKKRVAELESMGIEI